MDADPRETVVLVVDDTKDSRVCVKRILEGSGMSVILAADGRAALEILEAEPVDMILADIAMPGMNGYQLFEKITQNPRWVGIPFVFLTARSFDSDVRYGKSLGVDDYLTKPFRAADLLTTVQGSLLRAQRRRATNQPRLLSSTPPEDLLTFGRLKIDPDRFIVLMDGRKIQLSSREFRLLLHLVENRSRVVPMEELVRTTHDISVDYGEAGGLLRPLVRSIRRKLGFERGEWGCIRSVRGIGYQFTLS
jgi:DNA-binding response OmpR family regulator